MTFDQFPNLIFISSNTPDGNMAFAKGEKNEVLKNRQSFFSRIKIPLNKAVIMSLVHGVRVRKINTLDKELVEADGLITDQKEIYLFLVTADCIPLAFYDYKKQIISLVHASRINLTRGIIKNTVKKFIQHFNSNPQDLLVKFGPSIGPCCYLKEKIPHLKVSSWQKYVKKEVDKYSIDMWQFAQNQLISLGVKKINIENPKICTYHWGKYFSHRKAMDQNLPDYRFATVFGIK